MRVDLPRNPDWKMPAIVTASKAATIAIMSHGKSACGERFQDFARIKNSRTALGGEFADWGANLPPAVLAGCGILQGLS